MTANYHTHTPRCRHASGTEREYAENARKGGLRILGFSDHTPYDYFDSAPRSRPIRMTPEELPGYADSVRALAAEYEGRMEILLGVEAEYYPKYFSRLLEMLRENGVQYMILGQHFLGNEVGESYCGRPTPEGSALERYVSQTIEAMETGLFTYFAHPDLLFYTGDGGFYQRQMRRLCRAARESGTALELNLLGIKGGRNYPDARFWQIAGEEGNTVILGRDAHTPTDFLEGEYEKRALELAERFHFTPVSSVPIRNL